MLNRYKFYLFIILYILPSVTFSEVEVIISTDKSEYLEAEPIQLNFTIYNNSDRIDSVDAEMFQLFYFNVANNDNKKCTFVGSIGERIGRLYFKIEPYKSVGQSILLNDCFVNEFFIPAYSSAIGYIKQGVYSIQYNYNDIFLSNDVQIKIIEPVDKEKEAFNKLKEAFLIEVNRDNIVKHYLKQKLFYQIVLDYPESLYWTEAVYRYNQITSFMNLNYTDIDVNKEFINRFPDSFYESQILHNLCKSIFYYVGGEQAVTDYLSQIMANYPNSRVSNTAKSLLNSKDYLNN